MIMKYNIASRHVWVINAMNDILPLFNRDKCFNTFQREIWVVTMSLLFLREFP